MLKQLAAGVAVALALAGEAVAGPLEDADAAYDRGDYATTLRLLRPLAESGDPKAQFNIGVMYALGQGVQQDYAQTARWLSMSANQGCFYGDRSGYKYAHVDRLPNATGHCLATGQRSAQPKPSSPASPQPPPQPPAPSPTIVEKPPPYDWDACVNGSIAACSNIINSGRETSVRGNCRRLDVVRRVGRDGSGDGAATFERVVEPGMQHDR